MLIEASDPRYPLIRSAGEVVGKYGPMVRVRMIGANDNDDVWILSDSQLLRPLGTTESQGRIIQPPYSKNYRPCDMMILLCLQHTMLSI